MARTTTAAATAAALGFLLTTACGLTLHQVPQRLVRDLDRQTLLRDTRLTFTTHHIPIRSASTRAVDSGPFHVTDGWGGRAVEAWVDCGIREDGTPRARGRTVALRVVARFDQPVERGYARDTGGTVVVLDSEGSMLEPPADGRGNRCGLERGFAETLLTTITRLPPEQAPPLIITTGD